MTLPANETVPAVLGRLLGPLRRWPRSSAGSPRLPPPRRRAARSSRRRPARRPGRCCRGHGSRAAARVRRGDPDLRLEGAHLILLGGAVAVVVEPGLADRPDDRVGGELLDRVGRRVVEAARPSSGGGRPPRTRPRARAQPAPPPRSTPRRARSSGSARRRRRRASATSSASGGVADAEMSVAVDHRTSVGALGGSRCSEVPAPESPGGRAAITATNRRATQTSSARPPLRRRRTARAERRPARCRRCRAISACERVLVDAPRRAAPSSTDVGDVARAAPNRAPRRSGRAGRR